MTNAVGQAVRIEMVVSRVQIMLSDIRHLCYKYADFVDASARSELYMQDERMPIRVTCSAAQQKVKHVPLAWLDCALAWLSAVADEMPRCDATAVWLVAGNSKTC